MAAARQPGMSGVGPRRPSVSWLLLARPLPLLLLWLPLLLLPLLLLLLWRRQPQRRLLSSSSRNPPVAPAAAVQLPWWAERLGLAQPSADHHP